MFDPKSKDYNVTVDYSNNANCLYKICDLLLDKIEMKLDIARSFIFCNDGDKVLKSHFAHEFVDILNEFFDIMETHFESEKSKDSDMCLDLQRKFYNLRVSKYGDEFDKLLRIHREQDPDLLEKWIKKRISRLRDYVDEYFKDLENPRITSGNYVDFRNDMINNISCLQINKTYKEINHSINVLAKLTGNYDLIKNLSTLRDEALLGHKEELIKMEVIPE